MSRRKNKRCPECGAPLERGEICPCRGDNERRSLEAAAASFRQRAERMRQKAEKTGELQKRLEGEADQLERSAQELERWLDIIHRNRATRAG